MALIEPDNNEISLTAQADLLGLNRTSIYYKPVPPSAEEIAIRHRIDEIYTRHPITVLDVLQPNYTRERACKSKEDSTLYA